MNKNEEKEVSAEKLTLISKEVLVPVLLFSFMLAIYAPLDIYLSNKGYFFFNSRAFQIIKISPNKVLHYTFITSQIFGPH